MTIEQLLEQIEVQTSLAKMMPANFSRQAIEAIAIMVELYQVKTMGDMTIE
jgi:hypothetical protein